MEDSQAITQGLSEAIASYDTHSAVAWANRAIAAAIDPMIALNALTDAIRKVGEGFEKGDLWLPDLIAAAETMAAATKILETEIAKSGSGALPANPDGARPAIVVGTVLGDIHDIGKNIVATMLRADGFSVHDLGTNIAAEQFAEAVVSHQAAILAMSALLSTTAKEQKKVIELLQERGLRDRVKVMVGGGGISRDFADKIGADGYAPTAPGAVKLAKQFTDR